MYCPLQVREKAAFRGRIGTQASPRPGHTWGKWHSWRHLSLVNNPGSDNKSAVFALMRYDPVKLNVIAMWDLGRSIYVSRPSCMPPSARECPGGIVFEGWLDVRLLLHGRRTWRRAHLAPLRTRF